MSKKSYVIFSLLVLFSFLLSSCATPKAVATQVAAAQMPTKTPRESIKVKAAVTAAPTNAQAASSSAALPRNETLYIAGMQWATPTNFSPLAPTIDWPAGNQQHPLIYETLFAYNVLTGDLEPLLAKELQIPDAKTMVIKLQDGTRWQDGQDLTADDVVYTLALAQTNKDLPYSAFGNYITDIKATDSRTIQLTLAENISPNTVKTQLMQIFILPKHIWETRAAPLSRFTEMNPVGSGPYKLLEATAERIALERDDNYWGQTIMGGLPAPKYVVHPIFKNNDDGNIALQNGTVDFSQQFTPALWETFGQGVGTWFKVSPYYIPGQIPMAIINVNKKGLDNVLVRKALAYSINYASIAKLAMSDYSIPANSSLIIPDGAEKKYYDEAQVKELGWSYDPAKAKDILENQLKATKGPDGIYVLPDGTRLGPWTIQTPMGWTDWNAACEIFAQNAKEAGFDIRTEFPEYSVVYTRMQNGEFDILMYNYTGAGPASPLQRFRDAMDIRESAGIGQTAFRNYGRFKNDQVAPLLDAAGKETDEAKLKDIYAQLDKIFMENVPEIPMMYRPLQFYEFNTKVWTGFPTSDNPTAAPMHFGAGIKIFYQIKAR